MNNNVPRINEETIVSPLLEAQKIFYATIFEDDSIRWSSNAAKYIKATKRIKTLPKLLIYIKSHSPIKKKALEDALEGEQEVHFDAYIKIAQLLKNKVLALCYNKAENLRYLIFHDVSTVRIKEKELQERWDLLSNAQQASKLVNYEYDFLSRKSTWSDDILKNIEYEKGEIEPTLKSFQKLIHPEDRPNVLKSILNSIRKKQVYSITFRIITKTGKSIWVKDSGRATYNRFGLPLKASGILQDITEEKNIETELIQAKRKAEESDKLKSAFLANMSHEIRTPLNGILGFAQLLSRPNIDQEKREQYISIINNSGEQLMSIISDIIDIAKIESKQIAINARQINLHPMLTELKEVFKERLLAMNKPNIELYSYMEIDEENFIIEADIIRLRQILSNLIYNAIKFTHQGIIEFGYYLSDNQQEIIFYVKDTGVGISKEKQKIIFERFRQEEEGHSRSYTGSGLGLTICKSLIQLMGGNIWLKSQKEKGSTFYFSLPLSSSIVTEKGERTKIKPAAKDLTGISNKVVMVVDDTESTHLYFKELLTPMDITIIHAKDGEEALGLFNEKRHIDMVLLDIQLPGISGTETMEEIRRTNTDIPLIAHTAFALMGDKEKYIQAGFNGYLSKPVDKDKVLDILFKHLS